MSTDRVAIVARNLDTFLEGAQPAPRLLGPEEPLRVNGMLTAQTARELFEDQVLSRELDAMARELKKDGRSYYTISSAGHEQNAALGAVLRTDDPCFLHYRSGALMMARGRKLDGGTPLFDTLLSLCASSDDPISSGRHKVWGSKAGWVPPQTSTIASHLPKALGLAFSLSRARRLGIETGLPSDAIVMCSFGDASSNHATALAGINAARYSYRKQNPTPILFVCEDNKRGISVETPRHWIDDSFSGMRHLAYYQAGGTIDEVWDVVQTAVQTCRRLRGPVFLHLRCVRLWGHAGSDVETAYRSLEEIERVEAKDPLLSNARRLIETGAATPQELRAIVTDVRERVAAAAEEAAARPKLTTRAAVMKTLAPYDEDHCRAQAAATTEAGARQAVFGKALPERAASPGRRTLAAHLNAALADEMLRRPEMIVFGEDVGKKGGVYGVTRELQNRFGTARVFDTLLDETTILGVAQGAAHVGLLPVPEIQYLAYIHNALDQLRGEASSLSFFSSGQFLNPMVVRIAGFAYQKGFGGHFHNDNSIGALRDIPGLVLMTPSRGSDAARLLRAALVLAHEHGRVVCFLEPIALYHERDLYAPGDELWLTDYPVPPLEGEAAAPETAALFPGDVGLHGPEDAPLVIVSYANGLRLALRAARRLRESHGVEPRVLDLRYLNPLPHDAVFEAATRAGKLLVVDECRTTGGGVAEALLADLALRGFHGSLGSVTAADSFVPLASAANLVLVSEDEIVAAAGELLA